MDEKKVREAICCIKSFTDDTVCEECDNYDRCDRTMVIDNTRTAIEALEKQLPKKPIVVSNSLYNKYQCPRCNDYICDGEPICLKCKQPIDWLK